MVKVQSSNRATKVLIFVQAVLIAASLSYAEQNTIDTESLSAIVNNKLQGVNPNLSHILVPKNNSNEAQIIRKAAITRLPPLFDSPLTTVQQYSEETVILQNALKETEPEILRRNSNRIMKIEKFNNLRHKIGKMLKKDGITDKTKSLITDAFDKIINQMNTQCMKNDRSKNVSPDKLRLGKPDKVSKKALLNSWKSQFNQLIDEFSKLQDVSDLSGSKENVQFLSRLREFFFEIHGEYSALINQYDLNCHVIKTENLLRTPKKFSIVQNAYSLSSEDRPKNNTKCKIYIICNYELEQFIGEFYTDLLKAVIKVFRNYEAMYLVDFANEPMNDKTLFLGVMKDVINKVNSKFNETFSKENDRMDLDSSSDIVDKVKKVKRFIDETVTHVKLLIDDVLTEKGTSLPNKMRFTVKTDIMTNTDIELGAVQEKLKSKMCKSFEKCHGRETRLRKSFT